MDDFVDITIEDSSRPTSENIVSSPIVEQVPSRYKLKLRYKGFFKLVKNSSRMRYCLGSQKCIYMDASSYNLNELNEEVLKHCQSNGGFGVLEAENKSSWTWFLELVKKSIGTPDGLVISSDMQKGLEIAIMDVYPNAEHRECIRHLYSNFKKKYRGDFFRTKLWGAAKTYSPTQHDRLLKELASFNQDAITYLDKNHSKIWSRSKIGTISKCDYMTNNISEAFNSWIGIFRYQPVLDMLDSIREKIMKRFDEKRRIVKKWNGTLVPMAKNHLNALSKDLGEYEVSRSNDNKAEVKFKGFRWEVILDERKCTCRVWQVKGIPCVHAVAFIAFTRDTNWEKYVDPFFTIEKFKEAYALEIAPIPGKNEWAHIESGEKIYPPVIKRPIGRPKKNRIVASDEKKGRKRREQGGGTGYSKKKTPANEDSTSSG